MDRPANALETRQLSTILVVDDTPDVRESTCILLRMEGFRVEEASNGRECLEAAPRIRPDIVLLDIVLPDLDGLDVCRRLKEDPRLVDSFVVLCSGQRTSSDDQAVGLQGGADGYIARPIGVRELLARLDLLLRLRRMRAQLREEREKLDEVRRRVDSSETALRESDQMLAALVESSPLALIATSSAGVVTQWNPAAERLFGWRRAEVIGRCLPYIPITKEEEHDWLRGRAYGGETIGPIEVRRQQKDGSEIDVELTVAPLRDAAGNASGLIAAIGDIAERKRAQAERDRLAIAISQAAEAIFITDPAGTIQYLNPAFEQLTGYSREEALGETPRLLKSGKQSSDAYRTLWATICAGKTWRGRLVNRRKDGTHYTADACISPVRDAGGAITSFVAVQRDVTRELSLEAQFRQAQKMDSVGRLAGGMAHDFNNLLAVILNYTSFGIDSLHHQDPLRSELIEARNAAERAAQLTRQLLAFSRHQVLQPKLLDLNETISRLESMLRRLLGENIDLAHVAGPHLGLVLADPSQIEQVIINLAINARDAMPQGGKIIVETADVLLDEEYIAAHPLVKPGDYVLLSVTDFGTGMDAATQAKLFEPFFTTKEPGKGTGLGLSTVYGIVEQSQGHVEVDSEPGRGSVFRVYLPRAAEAGTSIQPREDSIAPVRGNETVLVLEDEGAVRQAVVRILVKLGYSVVSAATGEAAVGVCEKHEGPIHLLITDVVLRGRSGPVVAQECLKSRPSLRVLLMSGYTGNALSQHGALQPGAHFIAKPFSQAELARKVREALDQG